MSDPAMDWFLRGYVSERFAGFTVTDSVGYWEGKQERSAVLVFLHENTAPEIGAIEAIRAEYQRRFNQECTLREDSKVTTTLEPVGVLVPA